MKNKIFRLLKDGLNIPIYWFSFFIPKSKKIWVFGAWFGNKYTDNSKALYEYTLNYKEIKAIWLTHNKKVYSELKQKQYRVYYINSFLGYYYGARARYIFVSTGIHDVNKYVTCSQFIVQLWHGTPLKKILSDDKFNLQKKSILKQFIFPFNYPKYDLISATSELVKEIYLGAFTSYNEIKVLGYPRNDILLENKVPNKNIITYLPTHRGEGNGSIAKIFNDFNIDKLNIELGKLNYTLLIKLHYYDLDQINYQNRENINFINYDCDLYDLLARTDILITDYSSVYFDFLLTQRPIIFAPFDIDEYLSKDRELYFNYEEVTPGPKCYNWEEVISAIKKIVLEGNEFEEELRIINNKFNYYQDKESSKRIFEYISALN